MKLNFDSFLNKFTEAEWLKAVEDLLPLTHEVDRTAVQVWFRFYPLNLFRFVEAAEDREKTIQRLGLQGNFLLKDQIDSSHRFLYGHRYWKTVKAEIEAEAERFDNAEIGLADEVKKIATASAAKVKADVSLLTGIAAAGLMTLVQSGLENFKAAKGEPDKPKGIMAKSPEQIVATRAKDDSQGLLGFLKTINKQFSIIFDETISNGRFPVMNDQQLTSASQADKSQDWRARDSRCWDGVIPIECTAASCGTCWIGVIGGQEKLSEVAPRERRQMKVFGYEQPDDARPFLRLACQSRAFGNATIVIPPWNGVFGKQVYHDVEELELEPVTTSAKHLRETVREATAGDQK